MSDLRNALQAAIQSARTTSMTTMINEWDNADNEYAHKAVVVSSAPSKPEVKPEVKPRGFKGTSQAVFEFVQAHPGLSVSDIIAGLAPAHKATSVSSLLYQQRKIGTLSSVKRRWFTNANAYVPIPSVSYTDRKAKKAKVKAKMQAHRLAAIETTIKPEAFAAAFTPAPVEAPVEAPLTSAQILLRVNVVEAYDLYVELRQMFEKRA